MSDQTPTNPTAESPARWSRIKPLGVDPLAPVACTVCGRPCDTAADKIDADGSEHWFIPVCQPCFDLNKAATP